MCIETKSIKNLNTLTLGYRVTKKGNKYSFGCGDVVLTKKEIENYMKVAQHIVDNINEGVTVGRTLIDAKKLLNS